MEIAFGTSPGGDFTIWPEMPRNEFALPVSIAFIAEVGAETYQEIQSDKALDYLIGENVGG